MTELVDFSGYEMSYRNYSGNAGTKLGIKYNNEYWFLKFPKSTVGTRNIQIPYTTSPLSEYIGSHIYETIGLAVHETILGSYSGKIVVACRDFLENGDILDEFKNIKNTFIRSINEENSDSLSSGKGTILSECLRIIENNPLLKSVPGVKEHFWNMFVVDALIGNNDRNNGNWGIIRKYDGTRQIAPVYDNGNSFNNKTGDAAFQRMLLDEKRMQDSAYRLRTCIYFDDQLKSINPYIYIQSGENPDCNEAVKRIVPRINLDAINKVIDELPCQFQGLSVMSDIQKQYYKNVVKCRMECIFEPVYEELNNLSRSVY